MVVKMTGGWKRLSHLSTDGKVTEIMAATSDDGIGILAEWILNPDGTWTVFAMDTEGGPWEEITDFGEGECVPPQPPVEP